VKAQLLIMPVSGTQSWTVLDSDLAPVVPAERYLAYLAAIERSPNTVRAYAHSLALWFDFLRQRQVDWSSAGVEDVSEFVRWLRAPAANVIVEDMSPTQNPCHTAIPDLTLQITMNTKIRLITRIAFGFKSPDALIALAMLSLGDHKPVLPGRI